MKKFICVLLLVGMVVVLGACGDSGSAASERNISIATRAVETTDEFLDLNISARTARDRIDALAPIDTNATENADENSANSTLNHRVLMLRFALSSAASNDTSETYNRVLEERNALARELGIRRR